MDLGRPDEPVRVQISKKGFASSELEIAGGSAARTVVLKVEHRVAGRVTDAVTGKPIPSFAIIPMDVFRKDDLYAERMNAKVGKDGHLESHADRLDIPLRLRIEASGYRTQDGVEFRVGDDSSLTQNFRLQPSPPIVGLILDEDGQPAKNSEVLLATPTQNARLSTEDGLSNNEHVFTDATGRFTFPDPGEQWVVIARSKAGLASVETPADQHNAGTLRLRSWASVRGQFRDSGHPVSGALILLQSIRLDQPGQPKIETTFQATTDADGRFEFPRIPPGPGCMRVFLSPWKEFGYRSGPGVPFDLKPGQHAEFDLGGAGTVVAGKVALTGKVPADLNCTYSLNYLVRREPGIALPPAIASLGFDIRKGWQPSWLKTLEGQAYLSSLQQWFVKLGADGSFRISGVPPGDYDLAVEVYAKPSGCLVDPLARKVARVTVTAADAARGELTLPAITATVVPIPSVGDAPVLTFQRAGGVAGTLA